MGMYTTKEQIKEAAQKENVRFLRLMFTDILGTIKNVEVPISQLDKVLENKMMFDGSSIEGFVRINESDMYLYPDLDTWIIFPWGDENGKVAGLICDVYNPDGTPFAGDPRGNLKRALTHMEATGFKMGPFKLMDLIGMDINYGVSQIVWEALGKPERLTPSPVQAAKVAAGELGRKTGKGFYDYSK